MIEVIAEIGVNHNGNISTAFSLIDAAKDVGCEAVKFQLWNTERVYPRERWDEMKRLELSRDQIATLKLYCDEKGIEFLCTPDEIDDARFLKELGVKRIKTSSQDVTNVPFLRAVAELGLPMIVSTGACRWEEMDRAVLEVAAVIGWQNLTVLHCVSAYPAPLDQMNLRVLQHGLKWPGIRLGLSDHTIGNAAAVVALGMGATVFEKHITLDSFQEGHDHAASMEPTAMYDYVIVLREAELALGDGSKRIMPCEVENRKRYEEFIKARAIV